MTCGECGNVTAPGAGFLDHVFCKRFYLHMEKREDASRCRFFIQKPKTKLKTNADRIRAMTDEELAEWASIREMCFIYHLLINDPDLRNKCRIYENCKDCWLEWLKQEVK